MMWFLYAVGSAIGFGLKQITAKKALEKEHAAEHLASLTIILFVLSWIFLPRVKFFFDLNTWGLIYLKAVILTFSWLFAIKALRHGEISIIIPILSMSPVVLLFLSFFILGEIALPIQYLGVLMLLGGVYFLQADHKDILRPIKAFKNKNMLFLLVPLVGYSLCAIIDKVVLKTINPYTLLFTTTGFLSIHYFIIQVYKYKGVKDIRHAFKESKVSLILTAVFLFTSNLLYFMAVQQPNALVSLIIPIRRSSVFIVVLIGGKMFHEHRLIHKIIGCTIIIAGAALIAI